MLAKPGNVRGHVASGLQEGKQNTEVMRRMARFSRARLPRALCPMVRSNLILMVAVGEPVHGLMQGSDQSESDHLRVP